MSKFPTYFISLAVFGFPGASERHPALQATKEHNSLQLWAMENLPNCWFTTEQHPYYLSMFTFNIAITPKNR